MEPRGSPPGRSRQGPRLAGLTRAAATRPIGGIINKIHGDTQKNQIAASAFGATILVAFSRSTNIRRRSISRVRNAG